MSRPRVRRNVFLTHAGVNGGWHSAAYLQDLVRPSSLAEDRRRAPFICVQGAPKIYDGDLAFYSDEFDSEDIANRIDGTLNAPGCSSVSMIFPRPLSKLTD